MVITVFIDLKKAFDVVSWEVLLGKLESMGFRGLIYDILKSYLYNRRQAVYIDRLGSSVEVGECGVPQGSVLGPLLYSLHVLSLRDAGLTGRYVTFADDTVLLYGGGDLEDLERVVNADLERYSGWLLCNKLKINILKTNFIFFKQKNKISRNPVITIKNISIKQVTHTKYLGLIIDEKLNWREHMTHVTSKIVPMLGAIYRIRDYLTHKSRMYIYNSFFLSHFRYLLPLWGSCGQVDFNKMQVLQNKTLKILFKLDWRTHTVELHRRLGVLNLRELLLIEQGKYIFKVTNKIQKSNIKIVFSEDVHRHYTRAQHNLCWDGRIRTNIGLHNPAYRAATAYNELPDAIKLMSSLSKFSDRLKNYLMD